RFVAVEPKACPTLTKGLYRYDYGDTACTTPLLLFFLQDIQNPQVCLQNMLHKQKDQNIHVLNDYKR
ncbi:hypothetical protein EI021_28805, partial [Escherichia coli]|nr:hypothetical protein [Escherichia coli]